MFLQRFIQICFSSIIFFHKLFSFNVISDDACKYNKQVLSTFPLLEIGLPTSLSIYINFGAAGGGLGEALDYAKIPLIHLRIERRRVKHKSYLG